MLGASPLGVSPIGGWLELEYIEASNRQFEAIGFILAKPLDYRIMVLDSDGNKVGLVTNYRSITFSKRLNNYGQAEFDITVGHPNGSNLIDLRKNTIEIYRDEGVNSNLVWAGEQAVRRSNLDSKGNNWSEITCYTWFERFFHRFTEDFERYEMEDAGDVIEGLIAATQAKTGGDFGVTTGTINTTYTADIIYQNDNIGDAIIGLADGGLDFEITDGKELNVSSIIGEDKTNDVIIEYGHNVTNMTITEDFSQPVNQALILGEVIGEDNLQRVEQTNSTLRTEYKLRQTRMNQLEPAILAIFEDKGDAAIRKFGMPLIKIDFDLIPINR